VSGKRSRDKGKRGERWVAQELTDDGFPARRGCQYRGGGESPDVVCEALPFLHFEVKFVERLQLGKAMQQACADAKPGVWPVVVSKANAQPALATMLFDDYRALLGFLRDAEMAGDHRDA